MTARAATKSAKKTTFDQWVARAVRRTLERANAETAASTEQMRRIVNSIDRERAAKAAAKAKTAASQSWRTRWLNSARERRARVRNNRPDARPIRYAWPQYAGQILLYPEVHNSRVSDCVHVQVFDTRGVPVVRMSLTGTAQFIEGMVRRASEEVSRREGNGTLDKPDANMWDETDGLPVGARLGL